MAELDEKLNALLSDPGSMAQIVQMAQQLSATMGARRAAASTNAAGRHRPAGGRTLPAAFAGVQPLQQPDHAAAVRPASLPQGEQAGQGGAGGAAGAAYPSGQEIPDRLGGWPCITGISGATAVHTPASAWRIRRCRRPPVSVRLPPGGRTPAPQAASTAAAVTGARTAQRSAGKAASQRSGRGRHSFAAFAVLPLPAGGR